MPLIKEAENEDRECGESRENTDRLTCRGASKAEVISSEGQPKIYQSADGNPSVGFDHNVAESV